MAPTPELKTSKQQEQEQEEQQPEEDVSAADVHSHNMNSHVGDDSHLDVSLTPHKEPGGMMMASNSSSMSLSSHEDEDDVNAAANAAGNPSIAASNHSSSSKRLALSLDHVDHDSYAARYAKHMARKSCCHLSVALVLALAVSVLGFTVGNFSVEVDNAGWTSRGTLIANRQQQVNLVLYNQAELFTGSDDVWDDLINNVQRQDFAEEEQDPTDQPPSEDERRLETEDEDEDENELEYFSLGKTAKKSFRTSFSSSLVRPFSRFLQANNNTNNTSDNNSNSSSNNSSSNSNNDLLASMKGLEGCDTNWYTNGTMQLYEHLWPIWKTNQPEISALSPQVIHDICVAEQNTQAYLEQNNLCVTCQNGSCLPPYSLVFFLRILLNDAEFDMTCSELKTAWQEYETVVTALLVKCVRDLKVSGYSVVGDTIPDSCPYGFQPELFDEFFAVDGNFNLQYTSSIFATKRDDDSLYQIYQENTQLDRGDNSDVMKGTYETQYEKFVEFTTDDALIRDMTLAMGSGLVTATAILVHTRSPWLTSIGLLQVVLSFPLAYFVYALIAQLEFFPFLNFIGVFVVFALGANDIFVAVDKWKNARLEHPKASTEDIASIALPDAAGAMMLTTSTTAIAFFGTAICPVAPLKMFAIFNGLLIVFDYIMCCLLVFPALCMYDKWLQNGSTKCCVACHLCAKQLEAEHHEHAAGSKSNDEEKDHDSLIRRVLTVYFNAMVKFRWVFFVIILGAFVASTFVAVTLELPKSADVRILGDSVEWEVNYDWRNRLLSSILKKQGGSQGYIIWGVTPADTGNLNDPASWSQLVLDNDFDASNEATQQYLGGFCDDFMGTEYAKPIDELYLCPMDEFKLWLQTNSNSTTPEEAYVNHCNGATKLPLPQSEFDECIIAWSQSVGRTQVLAQNGKVKIIWFPYQSRVRYDSAFDLLDEEWNAIEDWMKDQNAPDGAGNMYSTSEDYWWYDTNGSMLKTAFGGAGIALAGASIVVLLSMRSMWLSLFSLFTIGFILVTVTAMLVASGWTLGFLESICFAILIGISCDFVLHFGHAYAMMPGKHGRLDRSQFAVIHMGPSILASAFTTICSATVMLFTVITFFQKFAQILFYTILMSTLGSIFTFVTLLIIFGPSDPTKFVDSLAERMGCAKKEE